MKRISAVVAMLLAAGCSSANAGTPAASEVPQPVQYTEIKQPEDKYTAYIKDYTGRNCASIGYESLGGDRMDYIGEGYLRLSFVSEDGRYIGTSDDEIKEYYVAAQSLPPNTEVRFTFEKDSEGNEYDNLVEWQSVDEIVLKVLPVGSKEKTTSTGMTAIQISDDKYNAYVKDYTGRNLGNIGYVSLGGDLRDYYCGSNANVKLVIITDDGSFVDPQDEEALKHYYVVSQNPAPNTHMTFEYETDSDGYEYSFTKWQSIAEIELRVTATEIPLSEPEQETVIVDTKTAAEETVSTTGYESIYQEYEQKLRAKTPDLINEYNQEKLANKDGLSGLAGIANNKVLELAGIVNEGVGKLANEYYLHGDGNYDAYEEWSQKLYDVYMEESDKIYEVYMNSIY